MDSTLGKRQRPLQKEDEKVSKRIRVETENSKRGHKTQVIAPTIAAVVPTASSSTTPPASQNNKAARSHSPKSKTSLPRPCPPRRVSLLSDDTPLDDSSPKPVATCELPLPPPTDVVPPRRLQTQVSSLSTNGDSADDTSRDEDSVCTVTTSSSFTQSETPNKPTSKTVEEFRPTTPQAVVPSTRSMALVRLLKRLQIALTVIVGLVWLMETQLAPTRLGPDSVYVPGGGFSGFWYTLGRLNSLEDPTTKQYYCYSAGCLGVVATLSNYTSQDMSNLAFSVQHRWKAGNITRYQVVGDFVDGLLYGKYSDLWLRSRENLQDVFMMDSFMQDDNAALSSVTNISSNQGAVTSRRFPMEDPNLLSRLHVITTTPGRYGLTTSVRVPKSIEELDEMLLQTTWIPVAVGNRLFYKNHMDGGFSAWQHPHCAISLGLPLDLRLVSNVVNVNLGKERVDQFMELGLSTGL